MAGKKKEPVAYYPFTYDMAMVVYDIDYGINDSVVWRFEGPKGTKPSKMRKSKIYYTADGDPYIKVNGSKFRLDEFQRIR